MHLYLTVNQSAYRVNSIHVIDIDAGTAYHFFPPGHQTQNLINLTALKANPEHTHTRINLGLVCLGRFGMANADYLQTHSR